MELYDPFENDFIKSVYHNTRIHRKPITGIVSGYHVLPYILVGPDNSQKTGSILIKGQVTVGPKMVIQLSDQETLFSEIFDEPEPFMDESIVGRSFSFRVSQQGKNKISHEKLSIIKTEEPYKELIESELDKLIRSEILNTGLIESKHPQFYPISIERFILSIIDKEFGTD